MAVVVALMPMAFAFGNGGGVPGVWLGAVAAMLLFAVGYVRIIPYVRNAGAFYAYIAASFGREWGLGAAYAAAFSYFALACSTLGALAFFTEQLFEALAGRSLHWSLWAFLAIALVSWLSYRRITLAAAILGVALVAEFAIVLLLDLKIVHDVPMRAFEFSDFSPVRVLAPGLGDSGDLRVQQHDRGRGDGDIPGGGAQSNRHHSTRDVPCRCDCRDVLCSHRLVPDGCRRR